MILLLHGSACDPIPPARPLMTDGVSATAVTDRGLPPSGLVSGLAVLVAMTRQPFHRIIVIGLSVAALALGFALPHPHEASSQVHQCQAAPAAADVPRLSPVRPRLSAPAHEASVRLVSRISSALVVRLPDSRAPPAIS